MCWDSTTKEMTNESRQGVMNAHELSKVFAVHEIREEALNQALELHAYTSMKATFLYRCSNSGRSQPVLVHRLRERTPEGCERHNSSGMGWPVGANLNNAFLDGLGQLLCDVGLCTEFKDCARSLTCGSRCLGREASHCVTIFVHR